MKAVVIRVGGCVDNRFLDTSAKSRGKVMKRQHGGWEHWGCDENVTDGLAHRRAADGLCDFPDPLAVQ
jgi:hypothetical protein